MSLEAKVSASQKPNRGQKSCQNNQQPKKKRIEYIDLMKGICIILVVLLHSGVSIPNESVDTMLRNVRMPLYFFLSGLFFKEYSSFCDFIVRKTNKLVVPYIFFAFFPFALVYLFGIIEVPDSKCLPARILYLPLNEPLWFLRGLFMTYILYYAFHRLSNNWSEVVKLIAVLILSFGGWWVNNHVIQYRDIHLVGVVLSMNVFVPFVALPYFYAAEILRKHDILVMTLSPLKIIAGIVVMCVVWYFTAQPGINYELSEFSDNLLLAYVAALSGIGVIWLVSYALKKVPVVSYMGRYSIIILGTHMFFIWTFNCLDNRIVGFALTIALMPAVIWIFKKCFPYFTAQKDLFYIDDNRKLRWGFSLSRK